MRIRKRQVPLPLSSLSPIPLSDPLFFLKSPPPPPRIHAYFPEEEKGSSNSHHSRGPDHAAEKALAAGGSSPAAEAAKRRSWSSNDDDEEEEGYKWDVKTKGSSSGKNSGKRRGSRGGVGGGGANAEGSRCSRVNGRGWRCGQLTLVGYSLCEHHLGKGRLRSMANVRGRSAIGTMETPRSEDEKPLRPPEKSLIPGTREGNILPGDNEEEDDEKEEDTASTGGARKKARSMSSLLGQKVSNQDDNGE